MRNQSTVLEFLLRHKGQWFTTTQISQGTNNTLMSTQISIHKLKHMSDRYNNTSFKIQQQHIQGRNLYIYRLV